MNTVTGNYSYKYNTGSGGDSSELIKPIYILIRTIMEIHLQTVSYQINLIRKNYFLIVQ